MRQKPFVGLCEPRPQHHSRNSQSRHHCEMVPPSPGTAQPPWAFDPGAWHPPLPPRNRPVTWAGIRGRGWCRAAPGLQPFLDGSSSSAAGMWAERFSLHTATGELRTATRLRQADCGEYTFTVTASDRGASPRSTTAAVRIQVQAVASLSPATCPTSPPGPGAASASQWLQRGPSLCVGVAAESLRRQRPFHPELLSDVAHFIRCKGLSLHPASGTNWQEAVGGRGGSRERLGCPQAQPEGPAETPPARSSIRCRKKGGGGSD